MVNAKTIVKAAKQNAAAKVIQRAFRNAKGNNRAASSTGGSKGTPRAKMNSVKMTQPNNPTFGAVSTVTTAPVAIGNSMKGFKARVIQTSNDSVRVVGRDFAVTAASTGTATGWTLDAIVPLTPAAFVSSVLRSYAQIYNKFKFNLVGLHYITSSSTATNGDVLFQVNANRTDPCANWTAVTFLPYALSKEETIIGPQWTNHSCVIRPRGPTRSLVPGQNNDLDYQCQGEIQLYSKTSSTESPGYLLIDYDITFMEMSINPKAGLIPNSLILGTPAQLIWPAAGYSITVPPVLTVTGTTFVGGTSITALSSQPTIHVGDVFKVVLDTTNSNSSSWTFSAGTSNLTNIFSVRSGGSTGVTETVTVSDGFTCYAVYISSTNVQLYSDPTSAFVNGTAGLLSGGSTATPNAYVDNSHNPNAGVWMYAWFSWVGSVNPTYLQQQ